ncbi:MAG: hypothetical protein JWM61_1188 [Micrococcaceae bacterium]|nr:hypothetical protein [Micrococcaceae bacterium]
MSATASAQRRRHHNETQASAPQETSTATCIADNVSALSRRSGLKKSAPSTAPAQQATASTALSRPVRTPVESKWGSVLGASSDAGRTSSTHKRGGDSDMSPD